MNTEILIETINALVEQRPYLMVAIIAAVPAWLLAVGADWRPGVTVTALLAVVAAPTGGAWLLARMGWTFGDIVLAGAVAAVAIALVLELCGLREQDD